MQKSFRVIAIGLLIFLVILGIGMRFFEITQNQFFYYDEGMWLNQNRSFVDFVASHPPKGLGDLSRILNISFHLSLKTAKALWAFTANLRGLLAGPDAWYFTRLVSAIFGSLTLWVTYLFSKRYFNSREIGWLSLGLLAILPSHLYYSRVGLQEGLSTFLFLAGLYLYVFPKRLQWRTFISGFCFACVFFSNYRMIIIPGLVAFSEIYVSLSNREKPNLRKFLWNTVTFFAFVFLIGAIDEGANTKVTFAWMFHQQHLARGHFEFFNLLSYPYYLFRLETIWFGLLFWGNVYLIVKRQWTRLFPFALTCFVMIGFSLFQEKGVRYLCAVMPFMVMAVAALVGYLFEEQKHVYRKRGLIVFLVLLIGSQLIKDYRIIHFHSDYELAMEDLKKADPNAKVVSTQSMVQGLYVKQRGQVVAPLHDVRYLLAQYGKGYRYLIIDPQAYVSYTKDGHRFTPTLEGYLQFIVTQVPPYKVYPHFDQDLLERFVLEHNENLKKSLKFIRLNRDGGLGKLRVYKIERCIAMLARALKENSKR